MASRATRKLRDLRDYALISPTARSVRADGLTYLSPPKLRRIESALKRIESVPGCVAEFGVALGGSGIVIATIANDRPFHGFDLFGTIPEPSSDKDDEKSRSRYRMIADGEAKGINGDTYYGYRSELYSDVLAQFARYGVPADGRRVQLHKGLFEEAIAKVDTGRLAFAHLDCDWYDPVSFCLDVVADRMGAGGLIVIDDYHDYGGCRTAVDEFLALRPEFSFEDGPNPILRKRTA